MTYKDLYDQMLNECSEMCATCQDFGASRILEELDPIAYRCGFCDWLDSVDYQLCCDNCDAMFYPDKDDVSQDDDIECGVCNGTQWSCNDCEEVFDNDKPSFDGVCEDCKGDE